MEQAIKSFLERQIPRADDLSIQDLKKGVYGASMEMSQFLNGTCPAETPDTPAARLSAASDRVMSLLHAAMNIEPVLGQFYMTLSDQQRRRFNSALR